MRVIVTGGSGFIGSAVVDELIAAGHEPIVVDKRIRKWTKQLSVECYDINILDLRYITFDFDAIIHMAALHIVSDSVRFASDYYDHNINTLLQIIELEPKKLIYSSSAAVYGMGSVFTEKSPTNPINPYGRTKLWGEQIIKDCNINHVSLRYFNAAGAGNNHGYVQEPRTHAIPIIMDCLHHDKPFTVFGDNLNTADGTCERDYTHVKDIAIAHVKALEYEGSHNVMNIGSGKGTSMLELIREAETVTGRNLDWRFGEARNYDPPKLVADITLAKNELKWEPKYTLTDIIHDSWRWENR